MKIFVERIIIKNRAPFDNLDLDFKENEIAVLTAASGRGKTTVLSYIVDAWYEMAKKYFLNEFKGKENRFYRISSEIYNIDLEQPSFVYIRFHTQEGNVDYVDIMDKCTKQQYDEVISLEGKIPFSEIHGSLDYQNFVKHISSNFDGKKAKAIFCNNVITYFPSYRYESPGYLTDSYEADLDFAKRSPIDGYLPNPLEVVTGLQRLANWIMDVVLDRLVYDTTTDITPEAIVWGNLSYIIDQVLVSKKKEEVRFGIGRRNRGAERISIVNNNSDTLFYPSIFDMSSGEITMLCIFGEILRQADKNNIILTEISGIVLIDEVDKHLHIKLQKEVLPKLFQLFPNVQFIVSSHSPFLNMGLAEEAQQRTKIIDLDNGGIVSSPTTNKQYKEVYDMMIKENDRFKSERDELGAKIKDTSKLLIVSEGNNIDHIQNAIKALCPGLESKVNLYLSKQLGKDQLKRLYKYELGKMGKNDGKCLFVWDCDVKIDDLEESQNVYRFAFVKNPDNNKVRKGVENLYPEELFTEDMYSKGESTDDYGAKKTHEEFNKNEFFEKIKKDSNKENLNKFKQLVDKIKKIVE